MADISKIRIGSTDYNIKDAVARQAVTNTLHFKGVSTVAVTNGGTLVPTNIYGDKATVASIAVGDMIIYGKGEYIWAMSDGEGNTSTTGHWILIDALNAYGDLAGYKSITVSNGAHGHSLSKLVVTGISKAATTSTGKFTPAGSVSTTIAASTAAAQSITLDGGSTGKLLTATYTPTSAQISIIDSVGSAPSITKNNLLAVTAISNANKFTATVDTASELLVLTAIDATITKGSATYISGFSTGSVPTKKNVTVVTAAPTLTYATGKTTTDGTTFGTGVAIALHSGATAKASSVTLGAITSTFTGTEGNLSVSGTPNVSATIEAVTATTTTPAKYDVTYNK